MRWALRCAVGCLQVLKTTLLCRRALNAKTVAAHPRPNARANTPKSPQIMPKEVPSSPRPPMFPDKRVIAVIPARGGSCLDPEEEY